VVAKVPYAMPYRRLSKEEAHVSGSCISSSQISAS
jgi:hypothetical protein